MLEKPVYQSPSGRVDVELSGELTVRTIVDVHTLLADALRQSDTVHINLENTEDVDLTFVQLVEAARMAARKAGKQLALAAPAAGALRETLERGGFIGDPASDRAEFWLQGGLGQ